MPAAMMAALLAAGSSIVTVAVPGHPFMALASSDGKTVFVSVASDNPNDNGIEVFQRNGSTLTRAGLIPLTGTPLGLALSPDGSTLFVANGQGVAALSAPTLEGGQQPQAHYLQIQGAPGTIEVQPSADGRFVFFTNESLASIGVASFASDAWRMEGAIPADRAPVGMALSHDGRWLYVTSEIRPSPLRTCSEGGRQRAAGTLRVIDAQKAPTDPSHAVVAEVPAGCSPVRVALSGDGATAWVTARGDNSVVAFDTAAHGAAPNPVQVSSVATGPAPVGIALVNNGSRLLVADSNRFAGSTAGSTVEVIDPGDASNKPTLLKSIPAGAFPREIRESPQRDVIFVTNYGSDTVEVIPEGLIR